MKTLGILICVVGTIGAILFVPTQVLGTGAGYHFIAGEVDFGFGITVNAWEMINTTTLVLELILINGVGLGLFFFGRKKATR